jgi:hypothetical protein
LFISLVGGFPIVPLAESLVLVPGLLQIKPDIV